MDTKLPWVPGPKNLELVCVSEDINDEKSLTEFLDVLAQNPGRRVAWSKHQSRGAARQRINVLKKSARFRGRPQVRFETRAERPRDPEAGVYILISWDDEALPASVQPTDLEKAQANKFSVNPQELANHCFMVWGKSLDAKVEEKAGAGASPQKRGAVTRQLVTDLLATFGTPVQE